MYLISPDIRKSHPWPAFPPKFLEGQVPGQLLSSRVARNTDHVSEWQGDYSGEYTPDWYGSTTLVEDILTHDLMEFKCTYTSTPPEYQSDYLHVPFRMWGVGSAVEERRRCGGLWDVQSR